MLSIDNKSKSLSNRKIVRKNDNPKVVEGKIKDWDFDGLIGLTLRTIFQNPKYIPLDPYKILIYILRSYEIKKSIHMDYLVNRVKKESTMSMYSDDYIKSISTLGDNNSCYGLNHISKLVDDASLKNVLVLLPTIRDALGNLPAKVTTKTIEATFVECSSINDGLAASLMTPRVHNFEVTIEAVVKGVVFDDCVVLFIRRVIEEAYCAGQSKIILSKNITVTTGKNRVVQTIPIKSVKTRRQQVLSLLKTAIVDEGEIYLEMFLKVRHLLPLFDGTDKLDQEPTEGFIYFKRIYKFNYIDENGIGRCFSRYPFQSLGNCIFFDSSEFELFLKVFRDNANRVREKERETKKLKKNEIMEDQFLENVLDLIAKGAAECIDKGEIIPAVEWLYQLQALQCADKRDLQGSVCIMQLASLGSSWAGQCRALQDVAYNVRSVYALVADGIDGLPAETKENKTELREERNRLLEIYQLLAPATIELKGLLIEFLTNCSWSEVKQMKQGLLEQMWKLFDSSGLQKPILDPNPIKVNKRGLEGVVTTIRELDRPLAYIVNTVAMLEASLGAIILSILLEKDEETYDPPVDATGVEIPEPPRKFNVIPNRISELLGYIEGRRNRHIENKKKDKGFFYDSEVSYKNNFWTPYVITGWLRYLIYGGHYKESLNANNDSHSSKADMDLKTLYVSLDNINLSEGMFLDITSKLSVNDIGLFGGIKLSTCISDEITRYDVPKVVVSEAVRIRYLAEAHVMRALHEAVFACVTQPQRYSPHSTLCSHLYRFSTFLQINDGVPDKMMDAALFDDVRHGRLNNTLNIFRAARTNMNISNGKNSVVEGCLVGPYSLLCGIGSSSNIFRLAWMIPPLFLGQPSSPSGMRVKVHSGISAETALHWGAPRLASFRKKKNNDTSYADTTASFYIPTHQQSTLDYLGRIQLEVVVKVSYEVVRIENQIKQTFSNIVSECTTHLSKYPSWRFLRILPSKLEKASLENSGKWISSFDFLQNEAIRTHTQQSIARTGVAVVECAVAMTEALPDMQEFADVLHRALQDYRRKAGGMDDGGHNILNDDSVDEESEANDEEEDTFLSKFIDNKETYMTHDAFRIFEDSDSSRKVQDFIRPLVKCYVPCTIRFTLITVTPPKKAPSKTKLSRITKTRAETYETSIGKEEDINRLIGSTLWLSNESAHAIWQVGKAIENSKCIINEGMRSWLKCNRAISIGDYCDAITQANMYALLTNRFLIASSCSRASNGIAMKLKRVAESIVLVIELLSRKDVSANNVNYLGQTIVRYVCLQLKLIIMSPESVHLHGGCYIIMKLIERVETLLNIGCLPVKVVTNISELPSKIPQTEKSKQKNQDGETALLQTMTSFEALVIIVNELKDMLCYVRVLVESFGLDLISNFPNILELKGSRFHGLNTDLFKETAVVLGENTPMETLQHWIKDVNFVHLEERGKGLWGALQVQVNSAEHILAQISRMKGYNPSIQAGGGSTDSRPTTASSTRPESVSGSVSNSLTSSSIQQSSLMNSVSASNLSTTDTEPDDYEHSTHLPDAPPPVQYIDPMKFQRFASTKAKKEAVFNIDLKALASKRNSPRYEDLSNNYDDDDKKAPSFSASGFRLVGDSVKNSANTKSMITMLRAQGNVSPPKKLKEDSVLFHLRKLHIKDSNDNNNNDK